MLPRNSLDVEKPIVAADFTQVTFLPPSGLHRRSLDVLRLEVRGILSTRENVLVPVAHIIVLHNALVPLLLCEVEQVLLGSLQIIRR